MPTTITVHRHGGTLAGTDFQQQSTSHLARTMIWAGRAYIYQRPREEMSDINRYRFIDAALCPARVNFIQGGQFHE
jgi:hypothetical protein